MNLYYELLNKPTFTVQDVNEYYHNRSSAYSALERLLADKMIVKIRNNLYTCISGETGSPVANRFQIASTINADSFVSNHTAMEYYGTSDQVFYDVYVGSKCKFKEFSFDGYTYRFIHSKIDVGVESPVFSGGIRISDRERTVVDSIKNMERISGAEEVIDNIASMSFLNEEKLLKYLSLYDNQFLYQKTGFILSYYRDTLGLSETFFKECKSHIKFSKRYFTKDSVSGSYDKQWNVVFNANVFLQKNGGIELNATL